MAEQNLYDILGVSKTATADEIKTAFFKLAARSHPDKFPEGEQRAAARAKYLAIQEAKEILTDAAKRAAYDRSGLEAARNVKTGTGTEVKETPETSRRKDVDITQEGMNDFFKDIEKRGSGLTREERRRMREGGSSNSTTPPYEEPKPVEKPPVTQPPQTKPSVSDPFKEASQGVKGATTALNGDVTLPLSALLDFRDSVRELLRQVDAAVERSQRHNGGPKP